MKRAPIGIFDSGLGGVSVLNEIRSRLPYENLIYLGDSAWCPYGSRPEAEIRFRVFKIVDFLMGKGVKHVVVACNSATIVAVESLRATYPIRFTAMEPAVKTAASLSRNGIIGVLATEASLAGEKFHRLLHQHASHVKVITRPCPGFVDLVERGVLSGPEVDRAVHDCVQPLKEGDADVWVLGCTHYPFLRESIEAAAGSQVQVIDSGAAVARQVERSLMLDQSLSEESFSGSLEVFTTGNVEHYERLFPRLCKASSEEEEFEIKAVQLPNA